MEENTKRGRGRPGTYANAAERSAAWRKRQKDLIAQAQLPAEPIVVEKIVEIERIVEKPVHSPALRSAGNVKTPDASALFPLLRECFTGYQGEEQAKRFRTNAAKAATAARGILSLAQRGGEVPNTERDFLNQAAQFFEHLNSIFHNQQLGARRAKEKADKAYAEKRAAEIKAIKTATFGEQHTAADVLAMAADLLAFDKLANDFLCKKYHVQRGYIALILDYELKSAIAKGDAFRAANAIAENRLDIGENGRRWIDRDDESCYVAGWLDFIDYRSNDK
jgi:hypothetical protein